MNCKPPAAVLQNTLVHVCAMALLLFAVLDARAASGLVDAARAGDTAAVRALLARHADANVSGPDGTTSLHWAAYNNNSEMAQLLIRGGADPRVVNRYGVRPIYPACVNGNAAIIRLLLDAGADPNTTLPEGETALMTAARTGNADAVTVLLDHGAAVNAKETWRGQTALMWAAAEGNAAVIRRLVAHGADIRTRSAADYVQSEAQFRQSEQQYGGFTALLFAAREGRIAAVQALLEAGADVNDSLVVIGPKGVLPDPGPNVFLLAAGNAHYELAAWLLDKGVNPNTAPQGWTALHQLAWVRKPGDVGHAPPPPEGSGKMDSFTFARTLLQHGADLNARATARRSPTGAGLNMQGATPFLMAARTKDTEYMRLLAELGADPLLSNKDHTTALMVAAGVSMSAAEDGETENELMEAVQVALSLGNDINAVDDNGETAMHGAAYKHLPSEIKFLAEHGAKVEVWNRPNKKGSTPLDIATKDANIGAADTEAVIRDLLKQAGVSPAKSQKKITEDEQ